MYEISSLEDIAALKESVDVECKLAQGRDGESEDRKGPDLNSGPLTESSGPLADLKAIADPMAGRSKAPKEDVEAVILALCEVAPLRLEELEALLNRFAEFLRKRYLIPLVKSRKLRLQYPTKPNHPKQAYLRGDASDDE